MSQRLFLYIDILNFSNIIAQKGMAEKLYKIIDNLNVFDHDPTFRCIVFSDTIPVYSDFDWLADSQRNSSIMWMCEFAQDLFYRLVGRDVHFRAILTRGEFKHTKLKHIDAFFGEALVRTYNYEKEIVCMGLFMDVDLVPHSDIFKTTPYDGKYNFVHIMQTLGRISFEDGGYPLPGDMMLDADTHYLHVYDFAYLQNIHRHMTDTSLHPSVRAKYLGMWQMLKARSQLLMETFERSGLNPQAICDLDWTEPMSRVGTSQGFFG